MDIPAPILVVEDDGDLAEIIECNLLGAGYAVVTAADGLHALQVFETVEPRLVILDLVLPTISGFRLIQLFKRLRPDTPVIVATALQFEEAEDAVRAGADDFVTKPFDPSVIIAKVNHFLNLANQRPVDVRSGETTIASVAVAV